MEPATNDKRAKEIETEYLSSLADLNVNSKPLINMLTILAEENLDYAQIIVQAVEKHLAKVIPDIKLPILYLIDSIVKNVGKQYQLLFSQVIVNMFCGVFETVNERIREKMFSLRQTWNEVFPQSKLYSLDIKINSIDPGWPITAQLKSKAKSPAIHLNPAFLHTAADHTAPLDVQQQLLRDKQRELLELQARKLELELMATKKRIEEDEKRLHLQTASVAKENQNTETKKVSEPRSQSSASVASGGGTRSRIPPVPQGMLNLVKSRDPRLLRQQAQMAAQMVAASTNSIVTAVPTGAIGAIALTQQQQQQSVSKPSMGSLKERLGKAKRVADDGSNHKDGNNVDGGGSHRNNSKRSNSNSASSNSSSSSPHKSRGGDYDGGKGRRDRKDETSSGRPGKMSSSGKASSGTSSRSQSNSSERKKSSSMGGGVTVAAGRGGAVSHLANKKKASMSSNKFGDSADRVKGNKQRNVADAKAAKHARLLSSRRALNNASEKGQENESNNKVTIVTAEFEDNNESRDIDLRIVSVPEKRQRLEQPAILQQQQQSPQQQQQQLEISQLVPDLVTSPSDHQQHHHHPADHPLQAKLVNKPQTEQNEDDDVAKCEAAIARDIDLRLPPQVVMLNDLAVPDGGVVDTPVAIGTAPLSPGATSGKKRASNSSKTGDEPIAKKSKAEKIDALFGNEDVDLRQLTATASGAVGGILEPSAPLPPPPPIISDDDIVTNNESPKSPTSKASFEAVRAKLAEATKHKDKDKLGRPLLYNKLPDDPIERRRSIHTAASAVIDVDLRQQQQDVLGPDDSSQDSMNANIKTIISQAQEQMDKGELTSEQYNTLMKQVIQLNETQKIRQAQRMEMVKRGSHNDDNNGSSGDEAYSPNSNDESERKALASSATTGKSDFRGKIGGAIEGGKSTKVPFEPSFANATAADLRGQRDPRRQREPKWNRMEQSSAWGNRNAAGSQGAAPLGNHRGPMPVASPWEQAPFPIMDNASRFPTVQPNGAMLMPGLAKLNDSVRTINIDGIQREIRFYDDIAIIFINWDEPKEIGFQKGARMVVVDDRETFELGFNEPYKSVSIDNKIYQMRLGAPTRELYIDDSWYECYFGEPPTTIMLDGKPRVFKIAGPAPQVKIGNSRHDLVAGKINMIINAEVIIPIFLDCKVQTFEIHGQLHKLQFADFLLTVLIDDHPFPVEYGGLPKVFKLRGKDFYIRFTALPKIVVPGRVYIRDMARTHLHRDIRTPPKDQNSLPPFVPPLGNVIPGVGIGSGLFPGVGGNAALQSRVNHALNHGAPAMAAGLDYLTNLMPSSLPMGNISTNLAGYKIEADEKAGLVGPAGKQQPGGVNIPLIQNIDISELIKKMVDRGMLPKTETATGSSANAEKVKPDDKETIEPILLNRPETLKKRQSAVVAQLFSGMQCSSCGVRFPPEQTTKYSQHLDWHFRQNRRDRDSARKAHSRKWYYDVSDWIQYEEIEDLEEREKNWFETQQTEQCEFNSDGELITRNIESPPPSCPAGSDENDKHCHMCHDVFEQFYNEETEEWHLKCAIRVEGSTYHPLCYEDYKASLTLDESALSGNADEVKTEGEDDSSRVKEEGENDSMNVNDDDDDDDVIVLPHVESVTEIIDDDIETVDSPSNGAEEVKQTSPDDAVVTVTEEVAAVDRSENEESTTVDKEVETVLPKEPLSDGRKTPTMTETQIDEDLFIREPNIEITDLDEIEDKPLSSADDGGGDATSQPSQNPLLMVKIKEEPKDDYEADEEDALFEDVGTIEPEQEFVNDEVPSVDIIEYVPSPSDASNSATPKPSIDGNVELQDAPAATTGIIPNRIKINITKAKAASINSNAALSGIPPGSSAALHLHNNNNNNENSNDSSSQHLTVIVSQGGGMLDDGGGVNENSNGAAAAAAGQPGVEVDETNKAILAIEEPTDLAYEVKPSLLGVELAKRPRVESGFETSGLCSIM